MRPVKRVGAVVLAAVVAFVVLNLVLALRPARKPLLPSPVRAIPEAQNGWPLLVEACGLTVKPSAEEMPKNYPAPESAGDPKAKALLVRNQAALDKLGAALARPDLAMSQADFDRILADVQFSEWSRLRELARLKSLRTSVRLSVGDTAGALRDGLDTCLLGRRLQQAGNVLIGYLVSVAVEAIGQRAVQNVTGPKPEGNDLSKLDPTQRWPLPKLSPAERDSLKAAIAEVGNEDDVLAGLRSAMGGELAYQRYHLRFGPEATSRAAKVLRWFPWIYDLSDSQRIAEESMEAVLAEAAKPAWVRTQPKDAVVQANLFYNPVGRSMAKTLMPVYAGSVAKTDMVRFLRRATGVVLALRLYADDHGRLPATLDELVTTRLLPAVPTDPFDGKPIRYLPRRGLLYSVANNHRDDGGVREAKTDKDDQAVWLPFVVTLADIKASQTATEAPAAAPK